MTKHRQHPRLVADQATQRSCPHWHPELQEREGLASVICRDCAAVIDSDLAVYVKHA